jgi:hypothetical protein
LSMLKRSWQAIKAFGGVSVHLNPADA